MEDMHSSTVKPIVATPRSQLKRKHGEIVDLTSDNGDISATVTTTINGNGAASEFSEPQDRQIGDDELSDDGDGDDDYMLDDALDEIELNPYLPRTQHSPPCLASFRVLTLLQPKAKVCQSRRQHGCAPSCAPSGSKSFFAAI